MVDLMKELERAARPLLPKPPGILIPGWFWQEWVLVGIVVAVVGGIVLLIVGWFT